MASEKKYDLGFLKSISDTDENFIKEMILTFKQTTPQIIIKMRSHIKNKKYKALGKEVHRLIPGVSFLGAEDIKGDLIKIEKYLNDNTNLDDIPQLLENVKRNITDLITQFDTDFNLS
jgi:HPt (histidine-containing phosphotransfer) domain-containing protein